ncbi:hypothetical protein M404DRAFT_117177, partial [Pisolithus tinctorius Marx 270]
VTGLPFRHVGEHFQRLNDTISCYFHMILTMLATQPFYMDYVQFPAGNTVPLKIQNNPKFWPYFCNAISTINGSHIHASPPAYICSNYWNRK